MAFFATQLGWLMTLESGRWSLDTEKRKRPWRFDGHKTNQQSGVLCHTAGLAYDPRIWALEPGHRKAQAVA
ncbi:hypothetical protein BBI08_14855 [Planococcus halocryophilus]|uniref:Uncharacterized protein n=1 Tax=Planococcus halocryophilus TaxID=1215089 RepID=A0A1C7DU98_9BACL|nr:hypothetical protein BBI08_14855 [Planococcus halocryophilus]